MSEKITSELVYLSSLFNENIYNSVKFIVRDFKWKTDVAKKIMSESEGKPYEWDTTSAQIVLSKMMFEKELNVFLEKIEEMRKPKTQTEIQSISKQIFKYHQDILFTELLNKYDGDLTDNSRFIEELKQIPTRFVNTSLIQPYTLGEKSASEMMERELGDITRIFPTNFRVVEEATPFKGYLPGQVVMFCSIPGQGKSATMLQEIALMIMDNVDRRANGEDIKPIKILHCAIGDMMKIDFITRFTAVVTREPFFKVVSNPDKYFTHEIRELANHIDLVTVPSKRLTPDDITDFVSNCGTYYDVVVIDYDSNVKTSDEKNSYDAGGELYDALSSIARPENGDLARLIFVASQPKISYWEKEEIPLEGAGESSRKQHAVDMMITLGKATGKRPCGILSVVKARRGSAGGKSPYIMTDYGHIEEVSGKDYAYFKMQSRDSK